MSKENDNSIEKIIMTQSVPDMVYTSAKKLKSLSGEQEAVPEFVLPKTKAEVLEEAAARLKTVDNRDIAKKVRGQITEKNKISGERNTTDSAQLNIKEEDINSALSDIKNVKTEDEFSRLKSLKTEDDALRLKILKERAEQKRGTAVTKIVGNAKDVVPFAWQYSLRSEKIKKTSKVFKNLINEEGLRLKNLPAKADDGNTF